MMAIFDHILVLASEAQARSALPGFCAQDREGVWHWDGSRVIAPIEIITAEAAWGEPGEDGRPTLVTPRQVLSGFWLAIALPELSTALRDLPSEACRLIANRDAANAGAPFAGFVRYAAPSLDLAAAQTYRVAPVFAGSNYPFGA